MIPLGYFYLKTEGIKYFSYNIYSKTILWLLWFFGLYIGYLASKEYDNRSFLGLRQIKRYLVDGVKEDREHFSLKTEGLLGVVRHPYYFASLILLWSRPLYIKDMILNSIFTIYFLLGAKNEERKLILEYGNEYIEYKKNVPMLIPKLGKLLKHIKKSFK
ncbi:MAG: isoprenylcysteine carboxylmethyltransferase family protein [Calditerrivibrio sp.]|nr:isoprenylcysteine carboxylmethyltransferase family protein [Calditerrivibrio sp.]MCA1980204.1 isoprenylcysteine carboxylmethyltransferase family protein [Calditerrivibrio sp.]